MLQALKIIRKTGKESFLNGLNENLHDYWAWAHSEIMGNAERGKIAEYIVGKAVGSNQDVRTEWDSYDVLTENGIKIEVKSSGYVQTWVQKAYSKILFDIPTTKKWNQDNNTYDAIKKRQADIYVFCVHNHLNQDSANPLDLEQWEFFILSTKTLDKQAPNQKTIGLTGIQKLGAVRTKFDGLKDSINIVYRELL